MKIYHVVGKALSPSGYSEFVCFAENAEQARRLYPNKYADIVWSDEAKQWVKGSEVNSFTNWFYPNLIPIVKSRMGDEAEAEDEDEAETQEKEQQMIDALRNELLELAKSPSDFADYLQVNELDNLITLNSPSYPLWEEDITTLEVIELGVSINSEQVSEVICFSFQGEEG